MLIRSVLPLESSAGATPYVVAAVVIVILFGAMLVLLAIGKGREHS